MAARKRQHLTISDQPESSNKRRTKPDQFDMPDDAVEAIVAFLPSQETAKLSVLSKRFRYSWKLCRNLCFDHKLARRLTAPDYVNIIKHFFQHRVETNIDSFKLYFDPTYEKDLVCSWIEKCLEMGIKELELDFTPSPGIFVLDSNLLRAKTLKILRLANCELDIGPSSNFQSNLTELRFQFAKPKPAAIQTIFSNCLALRTFEIMNCSSVYNLSISPENQKEFKELVVKQCPDIRSIRISAPYLCSLHYHGKICEFIFYCHFPRLEDVILDITPPRVFQMFPHREDLVVAIKNVKTLTVTSPFLEILSIRFEENEYNDVEFYLMNLREFHLIVQPESYLNPFDIAMFLKKCPRIERIFIDLGQNSFATSMYWDFHGRARLGQFHIIFPFLKSVKIKGFTLKELPVTMARFFLKFGHHMEKLVLVKAKNFDFPQMFTAECIRWEIKTNAVVEVYEHCADRSGILPKHFRNARY